MQADFSAKSDRLEAQGKNLLQKRADKDADKDDLTKSEAELARSIKELSMLAVNLNEEIDAEINKLTNQAAVDKARQKRKLETLKALLDSASPVKGSKRNTSTKAEEESRSAEKAHVNLDQLKLGSLI
jgi:hypothetical protein